MAARTLRLGTRGSALARSQSQLIVDLLTRAGASVEVVTITTAGDIRAQDTPWGEGAFVGALEQGLRQGSIDLAVHSAKDVPVEPETDLVIAAYPLRADARDALVTRSGAGLADLPAGATIGTDSPRRAGFLRAARPDLRVVPVHGNVDTRLRRLDDGEADGLVLAVAGLVRLGLGQRIAAIMSPELLPPAPGQGALAVQVRRSDRSLRRVLAGIDSAAVRSAVSTEREVLRLRGGGCRAPLGAWATAEDGIVWLIAGAVSPDGTDRVIVRREVLAKHAVRMARDVGRRLRPEALRRPAVRA